VKKQLDCPQLTIITICLNNLRGLRETYESIRGCLQRDIEWVVIDGYSSDGSQDYIASLREMNIRFVSEPDGGLYDAMNKGIKLATGEYIWFLNAGDRLYNLDAFYQLRSIFTDRSPDFVYADSCEEVLGSPLVKKARSHNFAWYGMFTHHQAMIYKRKIIELNNLRYNTRYQIAADYEFTAKFLKYSSEIFYLRRSLCLFEAGGVSTRLVKQGLVEQYQIRKTELGYRVSHAVAIASLQIFALSVKKMLPWIYSRLRFSPQQIAN
jgi:putative colanic acid biosynthesis glycosyltransferase